MPDPRRWPDRMSATDAVFWTLGRAGAGRPTTAVLLEFGRTVDERQVRVALQQLCDLWPRLGQRVVAVPFAAAPPEWIDDEGFALDNHFQRIAAPAEALPFLAAVRRRLSVPLREDRPLWQATLFDRAGAGTHALLIEVHHAATEGLGISRLLQAIEATHLQPSPRRGPAGRTPRLATPDALLWRALQYGIEELGESAGQLPAGLVDVLSAPLRHPEAIGRVLTGAVSEWFRWNRTSTTSRVAEARQRSRRLLTAEFDVRDLDAICAAGAVTADEVITTVLAAGLAAAWDELGPAPAALNVLAPVTVAGRPLPALVSASIAPAVLAPAPWLAVVARTWREVDGPQRLRGYDVFARALQGLPDPLVRSIGCEWLGAGNAAHLTLPGPARSMRFAGETVARLWCFPPLPGSPPVAVSAHVYRRRLHLGFDLDPHRAPDPGDLVAAIGDAWKQLRAAVLRPQLR
jgi:hypothetical protein